MAKNNCFAGRGLNKLGWLANGFKSRLRLTALLLTRPLKTQAFTLCVTLSMLYSFFLKMTHMHEAELSSFVTVKLILLIYNLVYCELVATRNPHVSL